MTNPQQIFEQNHNVSQIQLFTFSLQGMLYEWWKVHYRSGGVSWAVTFNVVTDKEMKNKRVNKFEDKTAMLGGCASWVHQLHSEDGSDDVSDDVMEKKTVVGSQQGSKGHEVGVNAGIH